MARVESPVATSVINALGAVNQPIATVSVQIADRIVAGTKQIEARVSGAEEAAKPVRTVKAKAAAAKKPVRRASAARKAA